MRIWPWSTRSPPGRRAGKENQIPPFAEYRKERFFGIDAESYYCASGFENILDKVKLNSFSCRVVRPLGFREFFGFLKNEGFLNKDNQAFTKKVVEANAEDNITLAQINIKAIGREVRWRLKTFSKKNEPLNSMRKITASVPAAIAGMLACGRIKRSGLLFMEELGRDEMVFKSLLSGIKNVVAARRSIGE